MAKNNQQYKRIQNFQKYPKRGGTLTSCDTRRCRARILRGIDGWRWPLFSPLDTIISVEGPTTLDPGYYLIKGPSLQLTTGTEVLEPPPVPHPGKAWVTAPRLAYLLDSGQVTWDDVTHCCKSTGSLTANFFDSLVDHLEDIATKEGFDVKKMV